MENQKAKELIECKEDFSVKSSNVCKAIAISAIVYFHCITCMDPSATIVIAPALKEVFFTDSFAWVAMFLFLSAYGYTKQTINAASPVHEGYIRITMRRLGGLYAQYWFVFLLAFILSPFLSPGWMDIRNVYGADNILLQIFRALKNFFGTTHLFYGDNLYTLNQTWWYMSPAIILILAVPVIIWQYRKSKPLVVCMALLLSVILIDVKYMQYLLVVVLGVMFANEQLVERINMLYRKSIFAKLIYIYLYVEMVLAWYSLRQGDNAALRLISNTVFVVLTVTTAFCVTRKVPILESGLSFVGKHAGNIFLIHSFIYIYYPVTSKIIYSLKYDVLIWLVTMLASLGLSILIEWIKKVTRWNAFIKKLWNI